MRRQRGLLDEQDLRKRHRTGDINHPQQPYTVKGSDDADSSSQVLAATNLADVFQSLPAEHIRAASNLVERILRLSPDKLQRTNKFLDGLGPDESGKGNLEGPVVSGPTIGTTSSTSADEHERPKPADKITLPFKVPSPQVSHFNGGIGRTKGKQPMDRWARDSRTIQNTSTVPFQGPSDGNRPPVLHLLQGLQHWLRSAEENSRPPLQDPLARGQLSNVTGFSDCRKVVENVLHDYGREETKQMLDEAATKLSQRVCELCSTTPFYCLLLALFENHPQLREFHAESFRNAVDAHDFNPEQLSAVLADKERPLLVNAGPGTGKTATLVGRILFLLSQQISPHRLIVITFTKNAAETLKTRISSLAGYHRPINLPFVRTIDSLASFYCRQFIEDPPNTVIPDEEYIKKLLDRLYESNPDIEASRTSLENALSSLYRTAHLCDALRPYAERITEIEHELWREGICTHRARLIRVVKHLSSTPQLAEHFRDQYYLLVDEFQDVDRWQEMFIKHMISGSRSPGIEKSPRPYRITVVGDDDQTIYHFRGAAPEVMERFKKRFDRHHLNEVTLLSNYRTIQSIIDFNSSVIALASRRQKENKGAFRSCVPAGSREMNCSDIGVCYETTLDEACRHTYKTASKLVAMENVPSSDIAILAYRNDECSRFTDFCTAETTNVLAETLISTIHGAKGLERGHVFVLLKLKNGKIGVSGEEERRRVYVALTRAKYTLHIVFFGAPTTMTWRTLMEEFMESRSVSWSQPRCIFAEVTEDLELSDHEEEDGAAVSQKLHIATPMSCPTQDSERTTIGALSQENMTGCSLSYSPTPSNLPGQPTPSSLPLTSLSLHDVTGTFGPLLPETHSLSATKIASYFITRCPRLLHRLATPLVAFQNGNDTPISSLLKRSGDDWERRITEWIEKSGYMCSSREKVGSAEQLIALIERVPSGHYIYEPNIQVPVEVNAMIGLARSGARLQPRIKTIKPDFLHLTRAENGTTVLQIIDAKFSTGIKAYQKIQVSLYSMILQSMLQLAKNHQIVIDQVGQIWLPGSDRQPSGVNYPLEPGERIPFSIPNITLGIRSFFTNELPSILSPEGEADFHLTPDCADCKYLNECYNEAKEKMDLMIVPGVNRRVKDLCGELGIRDIEDLGSPNEKASRVIDKPALRALSVKSSRLIHLNRPSLRIPCRSDQTLIISISQDPIDHTPLLLGYGIFAGTSLSSWKVYPVGTPTTVEAYINVLHSIMSAAETAGKSLTVWVGEAEELGNFGVMLVDVLAKGGTNSQVKIAAETMLRTIVVDEAIGAAMKEGHADPTRVHTGALCAVEEARTMFALPFPVSTISQLHHIMTGADIVDVSAFVREDPRGTLAVDIHNLRISQNGNIEEMERRVDSELFTYINSTFAVIQNMYKVTTPLLLPIQEKPFTFVPPLQIRTPLLSQLAYSRLMDATRDMQELSQERLLAVSPMVVLPIKALDNGKSWQCQIMSEAIDDQISTEPAAFTQYFVIPEDDQQLRTELLLHRDLSYSSMFRCDAFNRYQAKRAADRGHASYLCVATIHFEDNYLLFRRYTNQTLKPALNHLQALDADVVTQNIGRSDDEQTLPVVMRLVNGDVLPSSKPNGIPMNGWWPIDEDGCLAVDAGKKITLTRQHKVIIKAIQSRPVQLLIGPPGTGKSFFLGALILSRIHQAIVHRPTRSQIILLAAQTHSAIDTVIQKMLQHTNSPDIGARIIRLTTSESTPRLFEGKIIYYTTTSKRCQCSRKCSHTPLQNMLKAKRHVVIAGTVWALQKVAHVLPYMSEADVMLCIEEASLLPILETSVALQLLPWCPRNGSVLMVGDHLQIGTLAKGRLGAKRDEGWLGESLFNWIVRRGGEGVVPVSLVDTWRLNKVSASILRRFVGYSSYAPATSEIARQNIGQIIGRNPISRPEFQEHIRTAKSLVPVFATIVDRRKPMVMVILRDRTRKSSLIESAEAALAANVTNLLRRLPHSRPMSILHLITHHKKRLPLQQLLPETPTPQIFTIHKSQGMESDVTLILYASSHPSSETTFLFSRNLLNVALSRARSKCVIFLSEPLLGCLSALGDKSTAEGFELLTGLVEELKRRGTFFELDCIDVMQEIRSEIDTLT
ncbi:hypothetical protein, variant [Spizellomyces punctatus DAOM BR117]|uniref:DNA 3'-5' helicase n=1 Tax=Spizellomyces punctatus (strain DAOM BR117) TaxID=645134 RepID=A0A0L0H6L1_SPIPD|nr:hypothetical protein, variant [Spizellomyces punctatus DAOM BR117]KNC96872.1 hypothetical protein, variant [Spizellomyces punctatus DAOM BR117]|eukprot:XP_016604912.1 hypothetical protein, variant [Spizellomyces punctatus DAOM BR117]